MEFPKYPECEGALKAIREVMEPGWLYDKGTPSAQFMWRMQQMDEHQFFTIWSQLEKDLNDLRRRWFGSPRRERRDAQRGSATNGQSGPLQPESPSEDMDGGEELLDELLGRGAAR